MYFEQAGEMNTDKALEIAKTEAQKRGITHVIIASTHGPTGIKAAELFRDSGVKVVVVTHNKGFKETDELSDDSRSKIESLGAQVLTCPMVLRSLGGAIKKSYGYSEQQLVADVLRMFGQGMKVCVEIVAMACDAGVAPFSDLIAVAGTGRGADTVCIMGANSSNNFFDIKIREVLAKPREF